MITLESCDRLFASLRQHGFEVGVDAHLALANLWLNLLARGQDPAADKQRLAHLIGPLVCASARDQQVFPRLFDAWWTAEHAAPKPQPQRVAAQLLALPARSRRPWLLGVALLICLAIFWSTQDQDEKTITTPNELGTQQPIKNSGTDGSNQSQTSSSTNDPNDRKREHANFPPEIAVLEQRIRQRLSAMREEGYDPAKLAEFEAETERLLDQRTNTAQTTYRQQRQSQRQAQRTNDQQLQSSFQEQVQFAQEQRPSYPERAQQQEQRPIYQQQTQIAQEQGYQSNFEPAPTNVFGGRSLAPQKEDPLLSLDTRLGQWHSQQQLLEVQQRIALLGLEAHVLTGPERFYHRVYPYLSFLPLLFALPLGLWFQRMANALEQRRAQAATQVQHIVIPKEEQELYASTGFRRILQAMGVHRIVGSRQIDVAATIRATGQRGGIISPVQGQSRRLPEYLMLVDRHDPDSHCARMAEVLAHQLSQGGLYVDVLYFDRDPRHCTDKEGLRHYPGRDLQQRFQDYRLLICSDGSGLVDPFTLEPLPWLDFLDAWPHRTLLSPTEFWGYRERALAETGLWTLPMTETGLAQFMEFVLLESPPKAPDTSVNLYPPLLLERPNYWFTRAKPDERLLARLLEQLRAYLGQDFTWLAACAIYPSLHWDITLLLGQSLYGDTGDGRELRLLSLVRLPWFNRGFMPLWLRQVLIETLPAPLEQRLRELLLSLLADGTLSGENPGFKLEVHRELAGKTDPLAKSRAPHRDHVFLRFLSMSHSQRLALRLPRSLRALLFHRADPFNGPRWFWLGLLTLGACLSAQLLLPKPAVAFAYRLPQFLEAEQERAEMGPYFLATAVSDLTIGKLRNDDQSPQDYLNWLRHYLQEQASGHYVLMLKPPSPSTDTAWQADAGQNPASELWTIEDDTLRYPDLPPLCLDAPIAASTLVVGEREQLLVALTNGELRSYQRVGAEWTAHWSENLGRPVTKLAVDPTGSVVMAETDYLCFIDASSGKNLSLSYQPKKIHWAAEVQWAADLDQHQLVLAVYDRIYPDFLMAQPSQQISARRHFATNPIAGEALNIEWAAPPLPPPYHIAWSFGDGAADWGSRVQHHYTKPGSYTIKLTYTNHLTSETLERDLEVAAAPQASSAPEAVEESAIKDEKPALKTLLDPDLFRKEVLRLLPKPVPIASLASTASGVFALLDGSDRVWLWQDTAAPPLTVVSFAAKTKRLHSLAFSPDGQKLALSGDNGLLALRDLRTGKNTFSDAKEARAYGALGFLGNEQVVGAGADHTLKYWRSTHLAQWKAFDAEQVDVRALAFSPNLQYLASVGKDSVRIWSSRGKPMQTFRPGPPIEAVTFSPKGNLCAAACGDRTLRVWDLDQPKAPALVVERKTVVKNLGFVQDGRLALAEDNAITLFELNTRKERQVLKGLSQITSITTHTSSQLILACDDSGTLYYWDGARVYEGFILPDQGWLFLGSQGNFDAAEKTMNQLAKSWTLTDFTFEDYRTNYQQPFQKRTAKR